LQIDKGSLYVVLAIYCVLGLFIVVPVASVFYDSFTWEGKFTLDHYRRFIDSPYMLECLLNSLFVAAGSAFFSSLIGVPMAYCLGRFDLPAKNILTSLATLPLIMPPFVGALSFKFLFGRHGTINLLLMEHFGMREPINFIYGLHGVVLITSLHLYPLVMLNVMTSLSKIDPALEEAAANMGARSFHVFRTVTFPLLMPGFAAGSLMVFIWSFTDLGTPMIIGSPAFNLIAPQAFFAVRELYEDIVRLGVVMCVIMVSLSLLALAGMRRYVSLKQYAVATVTARITAKKLPAGKAALALVFCVAVVLLSILPHAGVFIGAFGKVWSFTPFPAGFTLDNFRYVLIDAPTYLSNSLKYSGLATVFGMVLGAVLAYLLARKSFPTRDILDGIAMLPFALPGIVLATGYLRAFRNPLPLVNLDLLSTWLVIPLALGMRKLPYTLRTSYATLQQIHVSLEEASMNLGATRLKTFLRITLPLMALGLLAGGTLGFISSITELSCSWLLSLPGMGWEPMTVGIMVYSQTGVFGQSAAMGAILIAIVGVGVALANKLVGARVGAAFGG
jgi:iron(III) transport system permease protein